MDAPVGGHIDVRLLLGAGNPDIGKTALFLQTGTALIVKRTLVREKPILPAGQEDGVELQSLGGMQCHEADAVAIGASVGVHHQ